MATRTRNAAHGATWETSRQGDLPGGLSGRDMLHTITEPHPDELDIYDLARGPRSPRSYAPAVVVAPRQGDRTLTAGVGNGGVAVLETDYADWTVWCSVCGDRIVGTVDGWRHDAGAHDHPAYPDCRE